MMENSMMFRVFLKYMMFYNEYYKRKIITKIVIQVHVYHKIDICLTEKLRYVKF